VQLAFALKNLIFQRLEGKTLTVAGSCLYAAAQEDLQ
jgi:hypothetical protein